MAETSSGVHSAARSFARGAGTATMALGAMVLVGWAFDFTALKTVLPGLVAMKPSAALSLVLLGIALRAACTNAPRARAISGACAAVALALAAATLSEDLLGFRHHIDQALFRDATAAARPGPPGRMAPATALGVVLLGAALLLLDRRRGRTAAQALAIAAVLVALFGLTGYLYGTPSLYAFRPYAATAPHAALGLVLVAAGVLCARPDGGLVANVSVESAGGSRVRRLLCAAVLVPIVVGWLSLASVRRGWLDATLGTALAVVSNIVVLGSFVWAHAAAIRRAEEREERSSAAQRESEERLRLAVEAAHIGLWSWDLATGRLAWTPGVYDLFRVEPGVEVRHADFPGYLHPDDRQWVKAEAERCIATGDLYLVEYRVVRGGEERWVHARGSTFRDGSGRPARMMGVVLDVTERVENERRRETFLARERAARAEMERNVRLKDEFLATLSHELRTPLTSILGWTALLGKRTVPPDERLAKGLAVIDRNARLQAQLIDDLLDMSRIITGKLRMNAGQVDLAEIVEAALDTMRPAAEAKGIRLVRRAGSEGSEVCGDPDRLQQIVWNLLSNAVKFTPRGGRIEVAVERAGPEVEIRVTDTGEGIAADFLPHMFDRFRQADASMTRRHGGLGIGLALVKDLVVLHGGTVRAASAGPGRGATFTVTLPADGPDEPSRPEPRSPA